MTRTCMEAKEKVEEKKHAGEEVKKEKHCSSIVTKWWSQAKSKEENVILDDDFQRKAEAKIYNAKNSGQTDSEGRLSGEEERQTMRIDTPRLKFP